MKRIALVFVFMAMLGLCACGQGYMAVTTAPTTTMAAANLEAVTLSIIERTWTGWTFDQTEPKQLEDRTPLQPGDTFEGNDQSGNWKLTIADITSVGVEAHFESDYVLTLDPVIGGVSMDSVLGDWTVIIPYSNGYEIFTAATNWKFVFLPN